MLRNFSHSFTIVICYQKRFAHKRAEIFRTVPTLYCYLTVLSWVYLKLLAFS